ncbi:MAG: hypothetical protein ABIE36_03265 [Candidatus Diapherotrites archaeon]
MIPKIEFRYSDIYDRRYRESKDIQTRLKKKKQEYPSRKEIVKYMNKAERLWKDYERDILKEISKITKLNWKEKKIICYVIGCGRSFSEPLTVRTFKKDFNTFIDTLTHELIHQISSQDEVRYMKWHNYVLKHYSKELRITKTHILLCAVHWEILEKMFGKKRLEKEIKRHEKPIDYKRAWKIVEEEGVDNILKKFYKIIGREK